jgi:putative ABC transport system ATP-binding protein
MSALDPGAELVRLEAVTRTVVLPDDTDLHILTGVDLLVREGDHIGIVGRSGTGKSTLLNLLGLLDRPTSGTLTWSGRDASRLRAREAARIRGRDLGFVFQQFNLLPGRTAIENVMAPLMYASGREFWQRRRLAGEMLDRVGLAERADSMPQNLSGGEQQRVAIARALVRSPRVVLADEPTGALDLETGQAVMSLLDAATLESGAALITITHDTNVAAMARERFRLEGGRLHALADLTDVVA